MARLNSASSTFKSAWDEYGGWIIIILVLFGLYSFRKLFSVIGNGAGDMAQATIAKQLADAQAKLDSVNAAAEKKKQQTQIQSATGSTIKFSDAQLAKFEADARSLAGYLGQLPGYGNLRFFKDKQGAFSMIKQQYSRLNLHNNKPWRWSDPKKKKGVVPQTAETKDSVKNPYDWHVLIPFYSQITEGRDLRNDFRDYVTGTEYTTYFKWIL